MVEPDQVSDPVGSAVVLTAAFGFFLAGCTLLLVAGTSLGTVHAFAAFVVLAIVAASNQLVPVLTKAPTAKPQVVIGISIPLAIGFVLLVAGFLGSTALLVPGAVVLVGSAIVWVLWTLARLVRGRLESETRAVVALSSIGFLVAASIGGAMAFALAGASSTDVIRLAPAHALSAIVLFASVLIAAVSRRLVPMFALAHVREAFSGHIVPWLAAAAGVAAAVAVISGEVTLLRAGLALALLAAILGAASHVHALRRRLRRRLDVSLQYAVAAWTSAIVAGTLAVGATWQNALGAAAVACAILGWVSLSIIGYAYKIAGFLAWQHTKAKASEAALPALADALPLRPAQVALALLSAGTAAIAVCLAADLRFRQAAFATYAIGGYAAVALLFSIPLQYRRGASCRTTPKPLRSSASTREGSRHPSRWS